LIGAAQSANLELVTWASDRDLVPDELMSCPCDFDADWCAFLDLVRQSGGATPDGQAGAEYGLKMFGAMGMRRWAGTPRRALHEAWQAARKPAWVGR
jgi:hypothetical protein